MLQLRGQFGRSFIDRYRLLRAVLIGFLVSFPLAWVLSPKEAISLGMLTALGLDTWLICRESWRMNADQTRAFFTQSQERSAYLVGSAPWFCLSLRRDALLENVRYVR